VDQVHADFLG